MKKVNKILSTILILVFILKECLAEFYSFPHFKKCVTKVITLKSPIINVTILKIAFNLLRKEQCNRKLNNI